MGRQKTRRVVSAAILTQTPIGRKAWAHIERQKAAGFTVSNIIVDALCRADGVTPKMFYQEGLDAQAVLLADTIKADMSEQLDELKRALLEEFGSLLLDELRNRQVITAAQHQALTTPTEGDEASFVDAMIGGVINRVKLRNRGG